MASLRSAGEMRVTVPGTSDSFARVEPLEERAIRASFVNCSKGEAGRIKMPSGLPRGGIPWADLDFFGWTDPAAPMRSLLIVPRPEGLTGVVLRRPETRRSSAMRSSMCQVCLTQHSASGVTLFVAPLAGASGRLGNTVGQYLCSDLACSLYLRGRRKPKGRLVTHEETLPVAQRIDRAMRNLDGFVSRVAAG
jgi:hypothetical protein